MAFNSDTYHRNKHRRHRDLAMAKARALKAELSADGFVDHYDVKRTQLRQAVMSARSNNNLFRMYRSFGRHS